VLVHLFVLEQVGQVDATWLRALLEQLKKIKE
jgi:hypothetical protein